MTQSCLLYKKKRILLLKNKIILNFSLLFQYWISQNKMLQIRRSKNPNNNIIILLKNKYMTKRKEIVLLLCYFGFYLADKQITRKLLQTGL